MTTFWKVGMGAFVVGAMIGLIWINVLPKSTNFNVYFTNAPLDTRES